MLLLSRIRSSGPMVEAGTEGRQDGRWGRRQNVGSTGLFRHRLAHPDRDTSVLLVASLTGNILTFGERLVLANLVGNRNANFLWDGDTALLWLLVASLVGNLPCMGLLHILALVVGNVLAGAVNGSPHLVVALTLPLELAIFLVFRCAFGFCIRLVNSVVLLDADIFIDS